jgi:hypothetical protein
MTTALLLAGRQGDGEDGVEVPEIALDEADVADRSGDDDSAVRKSGRH